MIGNKKLTLTLGSISAVAAPVAAVISCGAESKITDRLSPSEQDSKDKERISAPAVMPGPKPETNVKPELDPIYMNPVPDTFAKPEIEDKVEEVKTPTPVAQATPSNLYVTQFLYSDVAPKLPTIFEEVLTRLENGEYAFKADVSLNTHDEAAVVINQLAPFVHSYNALYNQLFSSQTMDDALVNLQTLKTLVETYEDMFVPKKGE